MIIKFTYNSFQIKEALIQGLLERNNPRLGWTQVAPKERPRGDPLLIEICNGSHPILLSKLYPLR